MLGLLRGFGDEVVLAEDLFGVFKLAWLGYFFRRSRVLLELRITGLSRLFAELGGECGRGRLLLRLAVVDLGEFILGEHVRLGLALAKPTADPVVDDLETKLLGLLPALEKRFRLGILHLVISNF